MLVNLVCLFFIWDSTSATQSGERNAKLKWTKFLFSCCGNSEVVKENQSQTQRLTQEAQMIWQPLSNFITPNRKTHIR